MVDCMKTGMARDPISLVQAGLWNRAQVEFRLSQQESSHSPCIQCSKHRLYRFTFGLIEAFQRSNGEGGDKLDIKWSAHDGHGPILAGGYPALAPMALCGVHWHVGLLRR